MKRISLLFLSAVLSAHVMAQNVGIGTPTPAEKLHIKDGNLKIEDDYSILFDAQDGDTTGIRFLTAGLPYGTWLYAGTQRSLNLSSHDTTLGLFYNFNTDKAFVGRNYQISSQEKFGITRRITTSDFGGMYIETKGHAGGKPFYGYALDGVQKTFHYFDGNTNKWKLNTGGDRIVVDRTTGNTGIGVMDPLDRLHAGGAIRIEQTVPTLKLFQGSVSAAYLKEEGKDLTLSNVRDGKLILSTADVFRMVIDSAGRVGIGISNPSEKLDISGSMRLNGSFAGLSFYNGSTHKAILSSNGNILTLYNYLPGELSLGTNDQIMMRIFPSGNIGMGTPDAMDKLHINGTVRIEDVTTPRLRFYQGTTQAGFLQISGVDMTISNQLAGKLTLRTNNTPYMTMAATGHVGIWNSNPQEVLHVGGSIRVDEPSPALEMYDGATFKGALEYAGSTLALKCAAGDILSLRNGASDGVRVYSNGTVVLGLGDLTIDNVTHRIGIGTTTPLAKLHVKDGAVRIDDANPVINFFNSGTSASYIQQTGTAMRLRNTLNGNLHLGTNNTDNITINSSGNVGIATAPSDRFHVSGNLRVENTTPQIRLFQGATETAVWKSLGTSVSFNNIQVGGSLSLGTENVTRLLIKSNGNVGIGANDPMAKLQVAGDVFLDGPTTVKTLYMTGGLVRGELSAASDKLTLENTSVSGVSTEVKAGTSKVEVFRNGNIELDGPTLVVDATNNWVGIGTNVPQYLVDVNSTNERGIDIFSTYGGAASKYGVRSEANANGTGTRYGVAGLATSNTSDSSPSYGVYGFTNGNAGAQTIYGVYGGVSISGTGTKYGVHAYAPLQTNSWALYADGNAYFDNDVRIGTTTGATGYKLSVDGKIIGEEVKVQLSQNWPDYVFEEGYELLSTQDLDRFITEHGHLPGVPSATEVEEANGIELGEMNRLLLEKVEELTLYILAQEKRIQALEASLNK